MKLLTIVLKLLTIVFRIFLPFLISFYGFYYIFYQLISNCLTEWWCIPTLFIIGPIGLLVSLIMFGLCATSWDCKL